MLEPYNIIDKERSQLVVKDNELIRQGRYNLTATQQKFLGYLISKIKPTDTELKEYRIRVEDFCYLAGIDKTYFYSEFKGMIDNFDEKEFWIETEEEIFKWRWFNDTAYQKGKGEIVLSLNKRLQQYLIGLSEQFTQYELYNILALKSKYAIRLFELVKSYAYQHEKSFEVEEIKKILFATHYTNFKDFRKRVLEPSIKEINEYTELEIKYETMSKGRKVIAIKIIITKKETMDRYIGYVKTVEKLDEQNGQIKGQMNLFNWQQSQEQETTEA